jgi:hypothetical protein
MSRTADGLTVERKWVGVVWRGYDAGRPEHAQAEEAFCTEHAPHGARPEGGPDRCGCGGVFCGCGAHYPAEFLTELPHAAAPASL